MSDRPASISATDGILQFSQVFKLMLPLGREVVLTMQSLLSPLCKTYGLTLQQFFMLISIKNNPNMTISQLCEKVGVLRANFAVTYKKLEAKNLAIKKQSKTDRRSSTLHLTEEAIALIADIDRELTNQLNSMFSEVEQEEIAKIAEGVSAMDSLLQRRK